jgi:hypothetical protein
MLSYRHKTLRVPRSTTEVATAISSCVCQDIDAPIVQMLGCERHWTVCCQKDNVLRILCNVRMKKRGVFNNVARLPAYRLKHLEAPYLNHSVAGPFLIML